MSPLGIVRAPIVGVGVTGYVGYDIYKAATKPTGLNALVTSATSNVKKYGSDAVEGATSGAAGVLVDIENFL